MIEIKYAGLTTLQAFIDKLKTKFATISHNHTMSDITDYAVDDALSSTSVNPVQNAVINAEFEAISDSLDALGLAIDEIREEPSIPSVTTSDNGKFLRVVNGAWGASVIPNAEEATF